MSTLGAYLCALMSVTYQWLMSLPKCLSESTYFRDSYFRKGGKIRGREIYLVSWGIWRNLVTYKATIKKPKGEKIPHEVGSIAWRQWPQKEFFNLKEMFENNHLPTVLLIFKLSLFPLPPPQQIFAKVLCLQASGVGWRRERGSDWL